MTRGGGIRAAVLSPHFDDAVLSCWNVLRGRGDVQVVNVFTAAPPPGTPLPEWDRRTGATDPGERMAERRAEDARALAHTGRGAVALGLLDAQYRTAEPTAGALAARLDALLAPRTVIYAPAALGAHPDHELVRDAALLLAHAGRPLVIYADLPHATAVGWPAWVTGNAEPPGHDVGARWVEVLAGAGLDERRLVQRVRPLDSATRQRKLQALGEYRTQLRALDSLAFAPLEDPRALAFEVEWDVPPSALGVAPERGCQIDIAGAVCDALHERG